MAGQTEQTRTSGQHPQVQDNEVTRQETNQHAQDNGYASNVGIQHVLRNSRFLRLWMAQLTSQTILNAANFGLVALVSARPGGTGTLLASLAVIAFNLPAVPFSAVAGVVVDKLNKRQVLWISNMLRFVVMLVMFFWLTLNSSNIWPLFGFIFLTSLIGQFFIPAEGASIPLLVGQRELMSANSLFSVTTTLSMALGYLILGGAVVALLPSFTLAIGAFHVHIQPIDMLYLIIAALYLVCVALILSIPAKSFAEEHLKRDKERLKEEAASPGKLMHDLWSDLVGGWHIIRVDRLLFFSVIQLSLVGIIMQLIGAQAGNFVKHMLNLPPTDLSFIMAPAAVGLVGASALMPPFANRVGRLRLAFVGLLALAIGFGVLPLIHWLFQSNTLLLFTIILIIVFIVGIAMACVNVPTQTMMQERSPEEGRARVYSLQYMIFSAGTIPVLAIAGVLGSVFGFNTMVFAIAGAIFLFWLWSRFYLRSLSENDTRSFAYQNNNHYHDEDEG